MPITPFHFGLGAALHGVAPKHVSFISFCAANVFIDIESLYNLVNQRYPVHAFFHTYFGASLIAFGTVMLFIALRWFASKFWLPDIFSWRSLNIKQVAVGACLGAYSHVVFDSVMHADIRPLAPFSNANSLQGAITLTELHLLCLALALLGAAIASLRYIHRDEDNNR
jgi:membrane-bound metal-dependent hydrolase YbcI (DUF457 family)